MRRFLLKNQIELQTIFRQTDEKYAKILNKLRVGKITNGAIATLEACVGKESSGDTFPTILLPRRRDADALNSRKIALLDKETEKSYKLNRFPKKSCRLRKVNCKLITIYRKRNRV